MKRKFWRTSELSLEHPEERKIVKIAGDAAIATSGTGHGRLIPLLILDTSERPDLAETIRTHMHFDEGDVETRWAKIDERPECVALILDFQRPTKRVAIIEFNIVTQGILVEHILAARSLYIQAGKPGDRLVHDFDQPKMLVEVPDTGFRPYWDKLYFDHVFKHMRSEGLKRQEAKRAARQHIDQIKSLSDFRMPAN